jgi:hypothetical protein
MHLEDGKTGNFQTYYLDGKIIRRYFEVDGLSVRGGERPESSPCCSGGLVLAGLGDRVTVGAETAVSTGDVLA